MRRTLVALVSFIFALLAVMNSGIYAEQSAKDTAVAASQEWLSLVDKGDYDESWNEAAGFLKNAVPKQKWSESLQAYRKPLGKLISRKLLSRQYATTLPGAPDGE
jgi:hypothetical protein